MVKSPDGLHFELVADAACDGSLVVFLGSGANYVHWPGGEERGVYDSTNDHLPLGSELSKHLARKYKYELPEDVSELLNKACHLNHCGLGEGLVSVKRCLEERYVTNLSAITQHVQSSSQTKQAHLKKELHKIFGREYPVTELHQALAQCAAKCKENRRPIFITTNYDSMVEQALADANEPFDVIYYRDQGSKSLSPVWLYHWKNAHEYFQKSGDERDEFAGKLTDHECPVTDFSIYDELPLGDQTRIGGGEKARSLVVKMHGSVSPIRPEDSSFVISDDDYIRFIRSVSVGSPLPTVLVDRLKECHFLFLGYGLGDWNILAICQSIWSQRQNSSYWTSAVQYAPSKDDELRWNNQEIEDIELFDKDVSDYGRELANELAKR